METPRLPEGNRLSRYCYVIILLVFPIFIGKYGIVWEICYNLAAIHAQGWADIVLI